MDVKRIKELVSEYKLILNPHPETKIISIFSTREIIIPAEIINEIKPNKQKIVKFLKNKEQKKKEEKKNEDARQREIMDNAEINYIKYIIGCDCGNSYIIRFKDCEGIQANFILEKIDKYEKIIKTVDIEKIGKQLGAEVLESTLNSYGGYKFNESQSLQLLKIAKKAYDKIEAKKKVEQEAKYEREKEAFKKAKETGKPVRLDSYTTNCNDPHEECNQDNVSICAMPDGTKKEFRTHTW